MHVGYPDKYVHVISLAQELFIMSLFENIIMACRFDLNIR